MVIVKRILFPRQLSPRPRCQQARPSNARIITCDPIPRAEPVLPMQQLGQTARRENGTVVAGPGGHCRQEVDLVVPADGGVDVHGEEALPSPIRRGVRYLRNTGPPNAQGNAFDGSNTSVQRVVPPTGEQFALCAL